jgi:hypothetical protein
MLFQELGYSVTLTEEQYATLMSLRAIIDLVDAVNALDSAANSGEQVAILVTTAWSIIDAVNALSQIDSGDLSTLPVPLDTLETWTDIAQALPSYLLIRYIGPTPKTLLSLLGIIDDVPMTPGDPLSSTRPVLVREKLTDLIADPVASISTTYGWGADFPHQKLLDRLAVFAMSLGFPIQFGLVPQHLQDHFFGGQAPPDIYQLELPIFQGWYTNNGIQSWMRAGLLLLPIPAQPEEQVRNLYIANLLEGSAAVGVRINDSTTLDIQTSADATGSMGIVLQPNGAPFFDGTAPDLDFNITLSYEPVSPLLLIGEKAGGRLELGGAAIGIGLTGTADNPDFYINFMTPGGGIRVIVAPSDGDSFVKELIGDNDLEIDTEIEFNWSGQSGLRLSTFQIELTFPLNLTIFFATIHELHLALKLLESGVIQAQADIDVSAVLGPFTLILTDIGMIGQLTPSDDTTASGTLGGLGLSFAFKPPSGGGVVFDLAGIVKGGGYLEHDPDKGEYSGIVTVEMLSLGITAIGIVTTKPPDNPGGWSMFVSINVDLGGIPLGFGFTLEKVGGLVGVHRSINTTAFQEGVRTGLLDSVLFPDDPIANAARILSDIETAFPTAQGSFVFGAMLQIGWGVPTLITGDLGFIIQVPDIIIALIGQVESVLPDDAAPLIEIHFDVVGIIDIAEGTLSIDAGIRDSRLLAYVLTGQMAMRASFIDNPSFLLAVGGFHPAFSPPTGFPTLDRVGFGIGVGDWLSITLETYLALTSNTLQFGAGLYLTANFVGFEIEGGTDINTLITFSPFSFRANLRFYITVSAGPVELLGVLLTGQISGPNPIFVRGVARFKILGIEEEVSIEESIGGSSPIDEIDEVDVRSDVVEAFTDIQSWRAVDEGARIGAVLLAEVTPSDSELLVHPGGLAEVVQRVAPLDVELEHYGNAGVDGEDSLDIADVEAGGKSFAWEFSKDWFAPAQFFDLADDEKLGAPSFEKMNAGIRFGDDSAESGTSIDTVYDYEQIIVDPEFLKRSTKLRRPFIPQQEQVSLFASQKGAAQKPLTSAKPMQKVTLKSTQYVIVERSTLTTQRGVPQRKMTFAEANQTTRGMPAAQIVVTSAERKAE